MSQKKLIPNILESKIKPNLDSYTLDELHQIVEETKINLMESGKYNDFEKLLDIKDKTRADIVELLYNLWLDYPLYDNMMNEIECVICLGIITNQDNMILKCSHYLHSSCYMNYLFTNITKIEKNTYYDNNTFVKIKNLFRCPKCRDYLTNLIANSNETYNTNLNEHTGMESFMSSFTYDEYFNIHSIIMNEQTQNDNSQNNNFQSDINPNINPNINQDTNLNVNIDLETGLWMPRIFNPSIFNPSIFNPFIFNSSNPNPYSHQTDWTTINQNNHFSEDDSSINISSSSPRTNSPT